jgi:purine-binding chemotaxis protein CheW
VSFELAGSRFALPSESVHEIVRAVAIEPLSHGPAVVSGVFNLRGTVVAVIDMRRRLSLPPKPLAPEDFFIVVELAPFRVALHVDRVLDLVSVSPTPVEAIAPPPHTAAYVAGVVPTSDGVLLIHDLPAFLSQAEASALASALDASGLALGSSV